MLSTVALFSHFYQSELIQSQVICQNSLLYARAGVQCLHASHSGHTQENTRYLPEGFVRFDGTTVLRIVWRWLEKGHSVTIPEVCFPNLDYRWFNQQ